MKNNKKHKRLPPREYRLSDDFLITYSVEINKRNKNKENYIVRYNIPKPLSKTQKKRNKKNYGCMILDQSLRVVVPTEGHNEINKILLNKIWEKDDTHQKVKIAIEEILTHKDNKKRISGVSLYLFVYMYYGDIKKRYSFDDEFFSALINDTDIRNIFLSSETTEDDITKAADSFYKKNQRTTKKAIKYHLNLILNYAFSKKVLKKYLTVNISKDEELIDESKTRLKALRRELVRKSLSHKKEKELVKSLINGFKKNNAYLGILIKMFTGMSTAEVCALQWNDYKRMPKSTEEQHQKITKKRLKNEIEKNQPYWDIIIKLFTDYSTAKEFLEKSEDNEEIVISSFIHYFAVTKRMKSTSKEWTYFDTNQKQKFRLVPITRLLDIILQAQKKKFDDYIVKEFKTAVSAELRNEKPHNLSKKLFEKMKKRITYDEFKLYSDSTVYEIFKDEINKHPIVSQNTRIHEGEEFKKHFTISTLNKYMPKFNTDINNKFENPYTKEIEDMEKSHSDFLHTNFQFHALFDANLTLGELDYILGNIIYDTFSAHYCDYSKDTVQIKLIQKLDLWVDSIFPDKENIHNAVRKNATDKASRNFYVEAGFGQCAKAIIHFDVEKNCKTKVTIENNHGFIGDITIYKTRT